MSKNYNPNLAKIHRNYTVKEVASLFGVHKNTVLSWINKHGLKVIDGKKPMLILGSVLREFLHARRTQNKRECLPHELYCLKCQKPQIPAGNMADYMPMTETTGSLFSLCPECESPINQYKSLSQIQAIQDKISILFLEDTKTHNQVG